jgi:hypothetical protein
VYGSIHSEHSEWPRGLPLPEPSSLLGTIEHFIGIITRVHGYGQFPLLTRFFNLVGVFRWLGAASGQIGSIGDMPQRQTTVSRLVEMQRAVRICSKRAHVLA